jgi:uncharacterized repeat protein (TIGR03803 family)
MVVALTWGVNSATGQTNFTILTSFSAIVTGGRLPWCTLADGRDGALYGTTLAGGISDSGTVFRVNLDGSGYVSLKRFSGPDGANPYSGLALGANGELFGTTVLGGSSNLGTIFRLAKDGSDFSVLHSFTGGTDAISPRAALIQGSDGALYGIGDFVNASNRGTIFRINPDGSGYSIIHTFTGNPDGQQPAGKLIEGSDSRLYGTTQFGGSTILGTVFSLQKDGSDYRIIYGFQKAGGVSPSAGLVEDSDGVLYGTASHGGSVLGGTVFSLNKDGSGFAVLHNFSTAANEVNDPNTELVEGADGALYGTAYFGDNAGPWGALYKLNKNGSGYALLRTLGGTSGQTPWGLLYKNGVFYGASTWGGLSGPSSIFALSNGPLPPQPVAFPPSGGTNLLLCSATSGFDYDLLRSTNLASWLPLTSVTSTNGGFVFPDVDAPQPAVFYRLQRH